jgi:8-oxo-dGTP diphosphatase
MVVFKQKQIGCEEALDLPVPECPQKKVVFVVAAALVDSDGRILLAQRPEGKKMAGLWEFPGGKVDAGETPEFALMRELREELGIETRPCCFSPIAFASHAYDDFHLMMPLFACRVWRNIPQGKEGQALKWAYPQDLFDYPMPEADIPLISQIQAVL